MFHTTVALISIAVLGQQLPQLGRVGARPKREEHLAGPVEVGIRLDQLAAEPLEHGRARLDRPDHVGLDRQRPGERGCPRDAKSRHRVVRHHPARARLPRHRRPHSSAASSTVRAIGPSVESSSGSIVLERRTEPHDVAEARGVAERPAEVAAVGDRHHPGRERRRGAARGPAGAPRRLVRVPCRAEHRVERVRARAELRRVGLADHHRARLPDPRDEWLVHLGQVCRRRRAIRTSSARPPCRRDPCARSAGRASGPGSSPRASASSSAAARARASSVVRVTIALTTGFQRSIRARCASSTSRADTSRAVIARTSSRAVRSQSSSIPAQPSQGAVARRRAPVALPRADDHRRRAPVATGPTASAREPRRTPEQAAASVVGLHSSDPSSVFLSARRVCAGSRPSDSRRRSMTAGASYACSACAGRCSSCRATPSARSRSRARRRSRRASDGG